MLLQLFLDIIFLAFALSDRAGSAVASMLA